MERQKKPVHKVQMTEGKLIIRHHQNCEPFAGN